MRERGINLSGFEMEVRSKDNGKLLRQSGPVLVELIGCGMAKGDRDLAEYFADRGKLVAADLDVKHAGWTALTRASIKGYLDIVKALLAAGADKDTYGGCGSTPLIWAATQGHLKVVQALLKAGAKADKANEYGETPLMGVAYHCCIQIVEALLKAGADLKIVDEYGETALTRATNRGHAETVQLLQGAAAAAEETR